MSVRHSLSWGVMVVEEVMRLCGYDVEVVVTVAEVASVAAGFYSRVLVSITDLDSGLTRVALGCSVLLSASAL